MDYLLDVSCPPASKSLVSLYLGESQRLSSKQITIPIIEDISIYCSNLITLVFAHFKI